MGNLTRKAPMKRTPAKPCSVDECERLSKAHGLCDTHYQRQRRTGDPLGIRPDGRKATAIMDSRRVGKFRVFSDSGSRLFVYGPNGSLGNRRVYGDIAPCANCGAEFFRRNRTRLETYCSQRCGKLGERT